MIISSFLSATPLSFNISQLLLGILIRSIFIKKSHHFKFSSRSVCLKLASILCVRVEKKNSFFLVLKKSKMIPSKAGAAGFTSAMLVMAWTGVYLSRHPRNSEEVALKNDTDNTNNVVIEVVILENNLARFTNDQRKEKVKEVKNRML